MARKDNKSAGWSLTYLTPLLIVAGVFSTNLLPGLGVEKRAAEEAAGQVPPSRIPGEDGIALPDVRPTLASGPNGLVLVMTGSAAEQLAVFDEAWSLMTEETPFPNLTVAKVPVSPDSLRLKERKRFFIRWLLPTLVAENERILADRVRLKEIGSAFTDYEGLSATDVNFLKRLARTFGPKKHRKRNARIVVNGELVEELLMRVDIIPPSLGLAQAAIESAWGSSRFAKLGNNLFGQWIFSSDKGIVPEERPAGANYSLASFKTVQASVSGYAKNLNRLWAYDEFRRIRAELRNQGLPLDGSTLADGVANYSTLRWEYVEKIKKIIRTNRFGGYDDASLADRPADNWNKLLKTVERFTSAKTAGVGLDG